MIYDFAIVGAGIAGASLSAELAATGARVLLLEAEDTPGYHATGRSAAFWDECYGGPDIVPLTLASGTYLRDHGFLSPRGALYLGRGDDRAGMDAFVASYAGSGATLERIGRGEIAARVPGVRADWTEAVWEPGCADIDVAGLHQHYLKAARSGGVDLRVRAELAEANRVDGAWQLRTLRGEDFEAAVLVDAAGAWADAVAMRAGVRPLSIQPYRRTIVQLRVDPPAPDDLPLVLDIGGSFYFKSEGGRLWLSPHDEEPSEPCDAAPEELAVAEAIDRLQQVVDWRVAGVERKWAGLRSFSPDRLPVYGYDPSTEGFAWFAGQGGYGIQTAPAAARLAAQILTGTARDAMTDGLDAARYDPARFV